MRSTTLILLAIVMATLGCKAQRHDIDRTTVTSLNVDRYMGRWYEIARFDHSFERNLEKCKAHYTKMPNGDIVVENSGFNSRTGREKSSFGKAKRGKRVGQLRVSFFLFFYSDYNILALDDNYQWALVGSKSPNYLWILSRTPSLPKETLSHILDIATKRGYNTKKLIWVKQ